MNEPKPLSQEDERVAREHLEWWPTSGPVTVDSRTFTANIRRYWATLDAARARIAEAERERDEAIGIIPGIDQPTNLRYCECGRRMVWDRPGAEQGPGSSWMCPRCVLIRCRYSESQVAALREQVRTLREALAWALDHARPWVSELEPSTIGAEPGATFKQRKEAAFLALAATEPNP